MENGDKLLYSEDKYINWMVPGSGFKVQRLQSLATAPKINQNPGYPSYPIE